MRTLARVLMVFVVTLAAAGALTAVASAEVVAEPWFHLTSEARPGNLAPASASVDERQEVTVAAKKGDFYLEDPETGVNDKSSPLVWDATAAQVQAVLEGFYGSGEVQVLSGQGDKEGSAPYVIVFGGKLTDRRVQLVAVRSSSPEEGFEQLEGGKLNGKKVEGSKAISVVQAVEGRFVGSELAVSVINVGTASANAEAAPIKLSDVLPPHVKAVLVEGNSRNQGGASEIGPVTCELSTLTCTYRQGCPKLEPGCVHTEATLPPFFQLEMVIAVEVEPGAETGELNEVLASGGGAQPAGYRHAISVSGSPAVFGVETFEMIPEEVGGGIDTQAGSHPFQLTSTFTLNDRTVHSSEKQWEQPTPVTLPKSVGVKLPAGLIGDPTAYPRCPLYLFEKSLCPSADAVGVASSTFANPSAPGDYNLNSAAAPIYNLEPQVGEPARFGFIVATVPVYLDTSVRNGEDYGVTVSVANIPATIGVLSNTVTFWGTPGEPVHDLVRGIGCIEALDSEPGKTEHPCEPGGETSPPPFLTSPTACSGVPLSVEAETNSWADVGLMVSPLPDPTQPLPVMTGCGMVPFTPGLAVTPEAKTGATPSGMSVAVHVPEPDRGMLAQSNLKDSVVTLPAGVQVDPSSANGLGACSETQAGFEGFASSGEQRFTPTASSCPDASKLGVAHVRTPVLPEELSGSLYLAEPAPNGEAGKNPFNSLVAVYLVVEGPALGVIVKLAGEGKLDPQTGQISTSFQETPQTPFEELKVELFGGPRAPVSTPAHCGSYSGQAVFTPWSGTEPVNVSSPGAVFTIDEGCTPSGSALAFAPGFLAQSANETAGAFSQFEMEVARPDGQQALNGLSVHLPAGIAAVLASVTPCAEPPAGVEWSCGPESLIGHTIANAGLGPDPIVQEGEVYLTGGYDGAPFGILARTPAVAGPFNLGWVNVRARIEVDPNTAAVTVTTDPGPHGDALPTMLRGIPVELKALQVKVDRPSFQFNPTNCNPSSVSATLDGEEGAHANVSHRFQTGGCEGLSFKPTLSATVGGQASKADGASFAVKVTSQGLGGANIQKVSLQLPKQLPSRLSTIQKACPAHTFEADPASCPEGSVIGNATVHTPILRSPLAGPAYLVSHGGAAFPDVEFILQGENNLKLVLDGKTDIKNGITYSKFESAPDAPFTTFETTLPAGPHSALTANVKESQHYDLCGEQLEMPTVLVGQNGKTINQTTKIQIQGCTAVKSAKAKKLTLAQQLQRALAQCRTRNKHAKAKRAQCERAAHARYTKLALAACGTQHKHSAKQRRACQALARRRYG